MPTAAESRAALQLVTGAAVQTVRNVLLGTSGDPVARRLTLLNEVPDVVGYFAEGSAALAADFYDDERQRAGEPPGYSAQLIIPDRTLKIRRGIAWSAEPLFEGAEDQAAARLAEVVQIETARPYRDTITGNRQQDPQAVGWRRVASSGCKFCLMLAGRGAVYRESSARFASHAHCHCTAEPVFRNNDTGEAASVMQYVASRRNRTAAQRAELRDYLNTYY